MYTNNVLDLLDAEGIEGGLVEYIELMRLHARVADLIGQRENVYVTYGSTKARDALTLTVRRGEDTLTVYADTVRDLASKAGRLVRYVEKLSVGE